MRISDWSSDVCSSDLARPSRHSHKHRASPSTGFRLRGPAPGVDRHVRTGRCAPVRGHRRGHDRQASHPRPAAARPRGRSEEHTSELQSLMRISYAVFCLKKKKKIPQPYRTARQTITTTIKEMQIMLRHKYHAHVEHSGTP